MALLRRNAWWVLLVGVLLLLAGCGITEEEAQRLVDESIAQALTAVPSVTPAPTATRVAFPPTPTPAPTVSPQPTATPLPQSVLAKLFATPTPTVVTPTPTPGAPPGSGPVAPSTQRLELGDGLVLSVDPAQPVTGRPIRFQLAGLIPWQRFTVTFLNSANSPVDWTSEDQVFLVDQVGQPIKTQTFYADGSGRAAWTRWHALDGEGQWTAQVAVGGRRYDGRYVLTPLQLATFSSTDLGLTMRRYSGISSEVYLSTGVPASVALDLSGQVPAITSRLESWLLLSSTQIPSVYLFANNDLFRQAITTTGAANVSPFASGIYRPSGRFRGIYVTLDEFTTVTVQTLVHEYTHLLVDEVAPNADVPAWLNEGIATYLENHVAVEFGAGLPAQRETYRRADAVKARLAAGDLAPLARLTSQQEWNAQADQGMLSAQYSQAYMAARYLTERYGEPSVGLLLEELERSRSFEASFLAVTGVSLSQFERDWTDWVARWQDPSREQVRQYVAQVQSILAGVDTLSNDRAAFLNSSAGSGTFAQRVPVQTQLVDRAAQLASRGAALTPPAQVQGLHQELLVFLTALQGWYQKELDAFKSGDNSMISQANSMIPEINARQSGLNRGLNSVQLNYWLQE